MNINIVTEIFLSLPLKSLSLKRNITINTGIDNNIGCVSNESAKLPLIKAKNALVIPHVKQGIFKNLCTKHPVSKYHIPYATNATRPSNKTLWYSFKPFIMTNYYCLAPLSNFSRTLTLAAKQSARHLGLRALGVSSLV